MDTNRTLFNFYRELELHGADLVYRLMPSRVKEFKKNNDHKIVLLHKKMNALMERYFKKGPASEEGGEMVFLTEGEGKDTKMVFNEGLTQEQYNDELKVLMDEGIIINF